VAAKFFFLLKHHPDERLTWEGAGHRSWSMVCTFDTGSGCFPGTIGTYDVLGKKFADQGIPRIIRQAVHISLSERGAETVWLPGRYMSQKSKDAMYEGGFQYKAHYTVPWARWGVFATKFY
jgi:hypothetical protein